MKGYVGFEVETRENWNIWRTRHNFLSTVNVLHDWQITERAPIPRCMTSGSRPAIRWSSSWVRNRTRRSGCRPAEQGSTGCIWDSIRSRSIAHILITKKRDDDLLHYFNIFLNLIFFCYLNLLLFNKLFKLNLGYCICAFCL
jgi:hypothetical protein